MESEWRCALPVNLILLTTHKLINQGQQGLAEALDSQVADSVKQNDGPFISGKVILWVDLGWTLCEGG